jgi:septal ring factor EnvC (AmiA/AmiB activator)
VPSPPAPYGLRSRGVSSADVERAADQLLRAGERPTVEKIRSALGTGSPNTINPLLDAWWRRLSSRLDAGPAALHRLPEGVAHVAESLWLQALDEGRRRALAELQREKRTAEQLKDSYEVRSHVLSLREGELDSRLRERERLLEELQTQTRTLTVLLHKEQRTRESQAGRLADLEAQIQRLRSARAHRATPPRPRPRRPTSSMTNTPSAKRSKAGKPPRKTGKKKSKP